MQRSPMHLNISVKTVETQMSKALQILKDRIKGLPYDCFAHADKKYTKLVRVHTSICVI